MTSADPREVCNGCFEHFCRLGILAAGESSGPRAQGGHHLARRQASLLDQEVQPADPSVFALVALALLAVAAPAILLPARRAARVDPMIALRDE